VIVDVGVEDRLSDQGVQPWPRVVPTVLRSGAARKAQRKREARRYVQYVTHMRRCYLGKLQALLIILHHALVRA
jgi:hypothetical protein